MTSGASLHPLHSVFELESCCGSSWKSIREAAEATEDTVQRLNGSLDSSFNSEDYSIVVFGSLARHEFTPYSDLDWTLLVDGLASDNHWDVARRVREAVKEVVNKEPGREGTFGSLAFAHELLHQIGGPDDTNRNTTRRILLLLESRAFGRKDAYDRVVRGILGRYLAEDDAFRNWRSEFPVPRFLLNDFARFWWTMTVDFAYKRRTRDGSGAVLRNIKLRMSRKLIYAAGLLACFSLALDKSKLDEMKGVDGQLSGDCSVEARVNYFKDLLSKTPLEILARHLMSHMHLTEVAKKVFEAYDKFLGVLSDEATRHELEKMEAGKREESALYKDVREVTRQFRDGLLAIFFDQKSGLEKLTKLYGVF